MTQTEALVQTDDGQTRVARVGKVKRVRDYSRGSIRGIIRAAQTERELLELRDQIVAAGQAGRLGLTPATTRKIMRTWQARLREIRSRVIVAPERPRLVIP